MTRLSFLAIEVLHLPFVVPRSRDLRHRAFDPRNILRRQHDLQRAKRITQLLSCARPDHRNHVLILREHPRDRELRSRHVLLRRKLAQDFDEPLILLEVLSAETWKMSAEIVWRGWLRP